MPDDLSDLTPEERSKRLREFLGPSITSAPEPTKPQYDSDLIPSVEYNKSPEERKLDAVLENIDIIDAYVKLIGKMQPEVRGSRTEGIKISCPMPGHVDSNPSAWINTEKQTWFCGGCQQGGDIYDLAAIRFGYDLNGYKSKKDFPVLRKQLAEEFGYTIIPGISGEHVVKNQPEEPNVASDETPESPVEEVQDIVPPEPDVVEQPPPRPEVVAPPTPLHLAPIIQLRQEEPTERHSDLIIQWEKIFPAETFGRNWMEHVTIDDLPHEYYFWLALQALGFAGGHNNVLEDFQAVKANFFICLYGRTGLGKSRSMRPYLRLLEEVFPFAGDNTTDPEGVRILPTPGSGEALIDSFRWEIIDPSTNKFDHMASVSGLVRHEELSGLISKAARMGSSIKEVMIEMYDVHGGDVTTHSRTSGISRAHNPFCQMISTTQPNAIHAFLRRTDIESGFVNRWVMAAGMPRVAPISYGGIYQDISMPVQLLKDVYVWSRPGHKFHLVGDALGAWDEFFHRELAPYKSGLKEQESVFSRIDLTLKKVIIALTLNERLDQPTADIVERAVTLYPYLQLSYSAFSKDMNFNDVTDCQARIVATIDKYTSDEKPPPTKRDLLRVMVRRFDGETVIRALRNLLDLDLIEEKASMAGVKGRPTVRYVLPEEK